MRNEESCLPVYFVFNQAVPHPFAHSVLTMKGSAERQRSITPILPLLDQQKSIGSFWTLSIPPTQEAWRKPRQGRVASGTWRPTWKEGHWAAGTQLDYDTGLWFLCPSQPTNKQLPVHLQSRYAHPLISDHTFGWLPASQLLQTASILCVDAQLIFLSITFITSLPHVKVSIA